MYDREMSTLIHRDNFPSPAPPDCENLIVGTKAKVKVNYRAPMIRLSQSLPSSPPRSPP